MNITSLREGDTVTTSASGMMQIEAQNLGNRSAVELVVTGTNVHTNSMSQSATKLTGLTGTASIALRPVGQDVFAPGTHVQVVLSRGRPNTPAYSAWELPMVTLDGRSELVVGQLTQTGDKLAISAVASKFDAQLGRGAETIRAALRSRLDGVSLPADMRFSVLLDTSASMSVPSTARYLATAADVITGMADELAPGNDIELQIPGQLPVSVPQAEIGEKLQEYVAAGKQRIGGVQTVSPQPGTYVVAISDQLLSSVAAGNVNALALVLGDEAQGAEKTIAVNASLATALEAGQTDAIGGSVDKMVVVARALGARHD